MKRTGILVSGFLLASLALSPAWAQGARNTSRILQQGAGNAAGIQQTGTANDAGVLQFGQSNTGVIAQDGTGNTACLVQTGRNLDGAIIQAGDNYTTGILQTRGGVQEIPVELCATAKSRGHVFAYLAGRRDAGGNVLRQGRAAR
jgi:Curlin associated repeat